MDVIIVRRGCRERFEQLRQVFSDEDVRLLWDRRADERRHQEGDVPLDRRVRDRRRPPPRSWTALDFIVIPDRAAAGANELDDRSSRTDT